VFIFVVAVAVAVFNVVDVKIVAVVFVVIECILVVVVVKLVVCHIRSLRCGVGQWGKGVVGKEVSKFIVVDVVVVGGVKNGVCGVDGGEQVVVVIFGVVGGLVGSPLNDEAGVLEKWLVFVERQRFNTSNGGVSRGELSPLVTR
jgi:hypothetical protein